MKILLKRKIKDLMFKKTKTSSFPYVRDELVLSPIVVTQEIIDHGIILYIGSGDNSPLNFVNCSKVALFLFSFFKIWI